MEKRVLLAIVLCFATLYLWQTLVVKPVVKPAADDGRRPPRPATPPAGTAAPTVPQLPTAAARRGRRSAAPVEPPLVGDTQERDVRVETQRRHRRVHESRRPAQKLAVEALSRSGKAAAGAHRQPRFTAASVHVARRGRPDDRDAQWRPLCGERRADRAADRRRRRGFGSNTPPPATACTPSRNSSSHHPATSSASPAR